MLVAAALSALVATSVAVATLKTGDVTPGQRDSVRGDGGERPDTHRHVRRPDDRDHARPVLRHGDEHHDRAQRHGRPVREEHVQHDEEARLGRWLAEGARIRQAHAGELHGDQRRRKARRLAPRLRESPRRRLFGSLAGSFSKTGGLTDGTLGTGTGANAAVIAKRVELQRRQAGAAPSVFLFVRGAVDSVSATAITVKPKDGSANQTCTVKNADQVKGIDVERPGRDVLRPGRGRLDAREGSRSTSSTRDDDGGRLRAPSVVLGENGERLADRARP